MPTYKEAFEKLKQQRGATLGTSTPLAWNPKQKKYQTEEEFTTAAKAWNVKQGKGKPVEKVDPTKVEESTSKEETAANLGAYHEKQLAKHGKPSPYGSKEFEKQLTGKSGSGKDLKETTIPSKDAPGYIGSSVPSYMQKGGSTSGASSGVYSGTGSATKQFMDPQHKLIPDVKKSQQISRSITAPLLAHTSLSSGVGPKSYDVGHESAEAFSKEVKSLNPTSSKPTATTGGGDYEGVDLSEQTWTPGKGDFDAWLQKRTGPAGQGDVSKIAQDIVSKPPQLAAPPVQQSPKQKREARRDVAQQKRKTKRNEAKATRQKNKASMLVGPGNKRKGSTTTTAKPVSPYAAQLKQKLSEKYI